MKRKKDHYIMRFPEKLLLSLSRKPGTNDYQTAQDECNLENALSQLCRAFPNFMSSIVGKKILDFGCGKGYQSVAVAINGANYVVGLDTDQTMLNKARDLATQLGLRQQVVFTDKLEDSFNGRFDIVISQNSMEHFGDPVSILHAMKWALACDGTILITFGPPWLAPYGGHMYFFTILPWVNIIFDERTVLNVRAYFRNDGATKYDEVEGGLNKMTVAQYERIISASEMIIQYRKYECVKGIDFLGKLPLIRELFINQISCALTKRR